VRKSLGAFVAFLLFPAFLSGAIFTVTNTNDSGPGSLRQAILDANATPGADTINFSIGSGPQTISPTSPLPTITDSVAIDGWTQPGFAGRPIVELSGASAGLGANGLHITAGNSTVRGLVINRFQPAFLGGGGNGVLLEAGSGNTIQGNYIGTNAAGSGILGNGAAGILVSNSSGNLIGGGAFIPEDPIPGNVISGNSIGVRITGLQSNGNRIWGNLIGTDATGNGDLGNLNDGVAIIGGVGNQVGGGSPNVISGNNGNGLLIVGPATETLVIDNLVGTNSSGILDLGNTSHGVEISGSSDNRVSFNTICGNDGNGVLLISGARGNVVERNRIGVSASDAPLGNAFNGVIASAANGNTIGGSTASARNIISANGTNGVRLRSGATANVV